MGLGKTIQTIAFLLSEKGKRSIIVTPTSLIYNWESEIINFAPTLKIAVVHGEKDAREELIKNCEDYDIILTTSLVEIGKLQQIPIVDHLIISDNGYYSFYENKKGGIFS